MDFGKEIEHIVYCKSCYRKMEFKGSVEDFQKKLIDEGWEIRSGKAICKICSVTRSAARVVHMVVSENNECWKTISEPVQNMRIDRRINDDTVLCIAEIKLPSKYQYHKKIYPTYTEALDTCYQLNHPYLQEDL